MKPGDIIEGKYELVRLLGEGAMGSVFEGRHVRIGRRVALKFLHRDHNDEPEILARFMREAQAAAAIGSEYIIEVTDIGETDEGKPYLVMEYLEGEDLDSTLEREIRVAPARVANLVYQACRAVGAAHSQGIIHRDIKPANIFLTTREDGTEQIKVLDFGIAKFRDSMATVAPNLTATGMVLGTPYYMPPEQARGAKKADRQSDIYSMGVLLYEMLTGEMPFEGETYNELIVNISTLDPTPPAMIIPELDPNLEAIVLKAMARDRLERYPSMDHLAAALLPFTDDPRLASSAAPSLLNPPLQKMSRHDVEMAATVLGEGDTAPRRKWLVPVMTLVVAAVVAVGAFFGLSNGNGGSEPTVARGPTSGEAEGGAATIADALVDHPDAEAETVALSNPRDGGVSEPSNGASATVSAASETVQLEISVVPAAAEITIDGIVVEGNPFIDRFPRDGARHRVEAKARGFRPEALFVVFDEDRALSIELQPRRRPAKTPGKRPGGSLERDNPYGLERANPYGS